MSQDPNTPPYHIANSTGSVELLSRPSTSGSISSSTSDLTFSPKPKKSTFQPNATNVLHTPPRHTPSPSPPNTFQAEHNGNSDNSRKVTRNPVHPKIAAAGQRIISSESQVLTPSNSSIQQSNAGVEERVKLVRSGQSFQDRLRGISLPRSSTEKHETAKEAEKLSTKGKGKGSEIIETIKPTTEANLDGHSDDSMVDLSDVISDEKTEVNASTMNSIATSNKQDDPNKRSNGIVSDQKDSEQMTNGSSLVMPTLDLHDQQRDLDSIEASAVLVPEPDALFFHSPSPALSSHTLDLSSRGEGSDGLVPSPDLQDESRSWGGKEEIPKWAADLERFIVIDRKQQNDISANTSNSSRTPAEEAITESTDHELDRHSIRRERYRRRKKRRADNLQEEDPLGILGLSQYLYQYRYALLLRMLGIACVAGTIVISLSRNWYWVSQYLPFAASQDYSALSVDISYPPHNTSITQSHDIGLGLMKQQAEAMFGQQEIHVEEKIKSAWDVVRDKLYNIWT